MIIASHLFKIIYVAGTILSTLYKLLTIVLSGFCIPILEMDMLRSPESSLYLPKVTLPVILYCNRLQSTLF